MTPFRFAIISPAGIARKFTDAVRRVPDAVVCAVSSRSLARAETFAREQGIPAWYDDVDRMLETERPDCVYVASVTAAHAALTRQCVAHGVPVLCEKAMFTNQADAKMVLAEAESSGVFTMEAMWSRFMPALAEAKRQLKAGLIGDVVSVESAIGFAPPFDAGNRYFSKALGGGAAYDLAVYCYELTTWLLEKRPEQIHAIAIKGSTGVDVSEHVSMRLEGDVLASFTCTLLAPIREHLTVQGTRGSLVLPKPHFGMEVLRFDAPDDPPVERWTDKATENGFVYEVQEVIRCVRAGLLESPVVPHRDTIDCAGMFDEIERAMRK